MALDISTWFEPRSSTFSYLIDDGQGACAVIDPVLGYDPVSARTSVACLEPLAQALRERDASLWWLLETHIHADHLSGAQILKSEFGGQTAAGQGVQEVMASFAGAFGWRENQPSSFDRLFSDGETFRIGTLQARVLHVPGHTPADVAYLVDDPGGGPSALFVGDTLFAPEVGTARCDFPGGDAHTLHQSISRLLALPGDTRMYLCHDYPASTREPRHVCTVAEQRADNIHVRDGISAEQFCERRRRRDSELALPTLMLPAVQFNAMAGRAPNITDNGVAYLRVPLNVF